MNLYNAIGGTAACRRLSAAFYARVGRDPLLRPLFPGKTLTCAIEEFAAFLVQFLGGPPADAQRRWWVSLHESHLRFKIGPGQRQAWMKTMAATLEEMPMDEPVRRAMRGFFEHASAYIVNHGAAPPAADWPCHDPLQRELSERWQAQCRLDQAAAAVRAGDAAGAIALAPDPPPPALLALMIAGDHPTLLDYVREQLTSRPSLAQERYNGRTLLHAAAGARNLPFVQLLLGLGIPPDTLDAGGHTPLYCLANESRTGGAGLVRVLVEAGADVNACGGVQRCTALHMAARRGNVGMAVALLDCGAAIDLRDRRGDTPLRRALNCRQPEVAALLASKPRNRA